LNVPNRFALIVLATERARQLARNVRPLVASHNKACVTALREIAANRVKFNENVPDVIAAFIAEGKAAQGTRGSRRSQVNADRKVGNRAQSHNKG
jgi:DNA-directed RNA polymerase subunit omega